MSSETAAARRPCGGLVPSARRNGRNPGLRRPRTVQRPARVCVVAAVLGVFPFAMNSARPLPVEAATGSVGWPTYHHDQGRSGVADPGPDLTNVAPVWHSPTLDGAIYAEP